MSFSSDTKAELYKQSGNARHCRIAELAAFVFFTGRITTIKDGENTKNVLYFSSEHKEVIEKCFTLLKKTFNIDNVVEMSDYELYVLSEDITIEILKALKMFDETGFVRGNCVPSMLLKNSCCRRAFLRGCYLCAGSMSDPEKGYHLEFVCDTLENKDSIIEVLRGFDIEGKFINRSKKYVVYLKDGESIATLLNVMEAHISLMKLENSRIVKEIKNRTNRTVNCEVANSAKTIGAASRQIADINYLEEMMGLHNLPDDLRQMAYVRLDNPDTPLAQLGDFLSPPIGKSGVNHRLRKLSKMADSIKGGQ